VTSKRRAFMRNDERIEEKRALGKAAGVRIAPHPQEQERTRTSRVFSEELFDDQKADEGKEPGQAEHDRGGNFAGAANSLVANEHDKQYGARQVGN
jgi:hypothetical protein